MLVTGSPWSGSGRIEVMMENNETKVCDNTPEYPLEIYDGAGSYWNDNMPLICGGDSGYRDSTTRKRRKSDCFVLKNGEWQSTSENLQIPRSNHAATNIGKKIWVTGGLTHDIQRLSSTEIIHPDGKVTPGPDLPKARSSHCQVTFEDTNFIIGKFSFFQKF